MLIKKIAGPIFTILVATTPIAIWWFLADPAIQTDSSAQKYTAIATAAALSAISLLAFNIILSARLPIFERLFLGLDRAYRAHRLIGGSILMLLLIHAMFLTAKYADASLISGYEFIKPSADIPIMVGKLALGIMTILVVMSVYIKVKYQWFITAQRILGGLLFLGAYHAFFVNGSDVRQNFALSIYLGVIGFIAGGLYIYRSILHKSIKRKYEYVVESVEHIENVTKIWLQPKSNSIPFYAGQFGFFSFASQAIDNEPHPFSFASNSDDTRLRIGVKQLGDYTDLVPNLQAGDTATVEGAYGHFSFTKLRSKKQVWIAAGIGITPFLSMAHSLPKGYDITFIYRDVSSKTAVFKSELEDLAANKSGLITLISNSDQQKNFKLDKVVALVAEDYLICGPPRMMHSVRKQLKTLGVKNSQIHFEEFKLV